MEDITKVSQKVEALRRAADDRDRRQRQVHDVRSGEVDKVMPGAMPEAWPKPIVANLVDTSARDLAEVMGGLPNISCSSGNLASGRAKKFSSKRTQIANSYVQHSELGKGRQVVVADHYITYGLGVYMVEPDFENKRPFIRVESPMGMYPETDAFGRLRSMAKVWQEKAIDLCAKFPHVMEAIRRDSTGMVKQGWEHEEIELVKYQDPEDIFIFLPRHSDRVVAHMKNPMGKVFASVAQRPGFDDEVRGSFDDAVWVQLAKARMALLGLEATEKTVKAPLAVPRDLTNMTFGDDAVLRTNDPDKIRRVGIDVPQASFQEGAVLEQELRTGTRTPEARSGNVDASIITGQGVEALMGGFNTVVTTGQTVLGAALEKAIQLCFEMDEKLWPDEKKMIRGTVEGTKFQGEYVPSKDIGSNHTVDVTYGFASGQDPARAIVGLLQLRGDQLISRDFFQRQIPMDIDPVEMQAQVDSENLSDSLKQGVMAYMQAILPMAQQGMAQDPMDALRRAAEVITKREKGKPLHEAVQEAFEPEEPQEPAQELPTPLAPQGPGGGAGGPQQGMGAAQGPQGADLMSLLSGLTGQGEAQMSARTQRQSALPGA